MGKRKKTADWWCFCHCC